MDLVEHKFLSSRGPGRRQNYLLTWMHDGNGRLLSYNIGEDLTDTLKNKFLGRKGHSVLSLPLHSSPSRRFVSITNSCSFLSRTINSRRKRGAQNSNLVLGFGYGIGVPMEEGKPSIERIKASNGLQKVVLREIRGVSIEVGELETSLTGLALADLARDVSSSDLNEWSGTDSTPSTFTKRERLTIAESVEIYLYGGQVISWKNLSEELLFVSSKAAFKPPKPIRGGIQICFPQVGIHGVSEQQGFARTHLWEIEEKPPAFPTKTANKSFVDLIMKPSEEELKSWPHSCEVRLRIALSPGGDLILTSRVRNTSTDGKLLSFSFAYLTYFRVSDISEVRVEGLETLDYLDFLKGRDNRFTEQGDAIVFESEVDKVYLGAPPKIAIIDHEKKRTFVLAKDGLPDIVVWNPWDKKAKAIGDLGDEEYKHMLCVGAAAVEKPITLKPGEEWTGRQEMSAVPSSYCSGQLDPAKVLQMSIETPSVSG